MQKLKKVAGIRCKMQDIYYPQSRNNSSTLLPIFVIILMERFFALYK